MNFLDKLDYLMAKYNLNKRSFSQASGIPYTTVVNFYKKGYDHIKLDTLRKVADYFNTTLDYLIRDDITDPNYDRAFDMSPSGDDEIALMLKYRSLSEYNKETIRLLVDRYVGQDDQK